MSVEQSQIIAAKSSQKKWEPIYMIGFISTLLVIIGTLLDIVIGFTTGGDLSALPTNAIDRFTQFQGNWLLGLYNLDLLNLITTVIMIPTYFALYAAHRRIGSEYVTLALIVFIIGAAVFIANNTALPMLELSKRYFAASNEAQKNLYAAAGEAMLASGTHGSPGAFPGFILSSVASIVMSFGMLKSGIFSKMTAYLGISGGFLLLAYLILVTFAGNVERIAMIVATPGGLLSLAWLILTASGLFGLAHHRDNAQIS
ncbi:MAG: DUF4386 domain-containing protein [Youngiibacter sp.]|nr:DUF4386 domain-containing protein [Youngiibacter sp.]